MTPLYSSLKESDIAEVISFFDRWSGKNFYTPEELQYVFELSNGASFIARVENKIAGVRLTHAPGEWSNAYKQISPNKWKVPRAEVAYFKSLFVSSDFQKMGIGKTLSSMSIEVLKKLGAKAILCHSWAESPGNSSRIYLERMGFEAVEEHKNFWLEVPYECVRCKPRACTCTGVEMIKYI
ncbi:MAG: GNAT family N-acetyltransferase [Halobacteriovorax sp.]|nr:GNAT family N-acetyltransferase [Halobacteriovorax sp.]|tara:strand:- start:100625 stop:101167 length:543 start_codon:yes stop_codon:yes gene_type:complete